MVRGAAKEVQYVLIVCVDAGWERLENGLKVISKRLRLFVRTSDPAVVVSF